MAQGRMKAGFVHKLVAWVNDTDYRELVDANLQDQTTDAIIANFNKVHNSTALATAITDITTTPIYDIEVDDPTGIVVGSYIVLFDPIGVRFSTFYAIAITDSIVTLDTPLDFEYPAGTFVDVAITDLAVDGSGTPEVFGLRGVGAPPGIELSFDLTRLIFIFTCDSAVALNLFGNLTALTRGLVLRSRNGRIKNIFNVKSNGEIAGIMYDYTGYEATNPIQGIDGSASRMTFAGQNKIGVAIRLPIGEDVEIWVQDDLTGLTSLKIIAEGHIVD